MNEFTLKQQKMINDRYKKNLAIINAFIKHNEIEKLNEWIDKKISYIMYDVKSEVDKVIRFTALTYALMGYREIAHQDYHNYLDKQIENAIHYSKEDLSGIYLEKYYEYIGL